jgi:hypothetical protein
MWNVTMQCSGYSWQWKLETYQVLLLLEKINLSKFFRLRHYRYCAIQIINSVISQLFHAWSLKDFVSVCSFLFLKVCRQSHVTWTSPDKVYCCQIQSADNQITPALGKNSYDTVKFGKIYDPAIAEICS